MPISLKDHRFNTVNDCALTILYLIDDKKNMDDTTAYSTLLEAFPALHQEMLTIHPRI